jgi:hypothetical protein
MIAGGAKPRWQFQQADAPGGAAPVRCRAEQVAVGGGDIDADQHRLARLEDFIVGADADRRQVVLPVVGAGPGQGGAGDAVDVPQRRRAVADVAEQFGDAAVRAVADEQQGQDEPAEPDLGHRQGEPDGVAGGEVGGEGLGQGLLGLLGLLVDELAAALIVGRQLGDGWRSGQSLDGQGLALVGAKALGGTGRRGRVGGAGGRGVEGTCLVLQKIGGR